MTCFLPNCTPFIAIHLNLSNLVLQYNSLATAAPITIQWLYCDTLITRPNSLPAHYVTIQCLYCDTVPMLKWAVAQRIFCCFFFFPFSSHFCSHFFPATGKYPKNTHPYFFLILQYTKQIYKNLFSPFFFLPFYTVKPKHIFSQPHFFFSFYSGPFCPKFFNLLSSHYT